MAEVFHRKTASIETVVPSGVLFHTVPAATQCVGLSLLTSYVGGGSLGYITAQVSGVNGVAHLVKAGEVQAGSSLELIANKLVLQSGDYIILGGSSSATLEATFSYLDLT